jgi:hypothetical protein
MMDYDKARFENSMEGPQWVETAETVAAIAVMRKTLAEPEQSEPVGEIVAWPDDRQRIGVEWSEGTPSVGTKLYTHPPRREPLSDDQTGDAYCETPPFGTFKEAFIAGIHYAEAAHGITGEKP